MKVLYAVAIGIIDASTSNSNPCYDITAQFFMYAHLIKPFIIAISIKCIPKQPICFLVFRLSPMIFMDVPYSIFVVIFIWFDQYECIANSDQDIPAISYFIILSYIYIHIIFPLLAIFRFIEVIIFAKRIQKFRNEQQRQVVRPATK